MGGLDSARYDAPTMTDDRPPLLTVTPAARDKIARAAASAGHPDACLRIAVTGRHGARFAYDFGLIEPAEAPALDIVVDGDGYRVYVDPASADALRGAVIDLDDAAFGGAITISNPNEGWADPLAARVQHVLDREINPGIASHGGYIDLLDVRDGVAYIAMGGGCQGCAQVDVTLRQGVEVAIKASVPEIVSIVDTTDHASGTNPYYQPSKK